MRKLYTIVSAIFLSSAIYAQDIKTFFVSMPDSVAPVLTKINREDCIDFLESNMKAKVKNRFGKISEMTKLTNDYIAMQVSESSTLEIKLLPVNDSVKVICMVNTYCAKACDSNISFFDTSWNKLDVNDYISIPSQSEYLDTLQHREDSVREAADLLNMSFKKMKLSENNSDMILSYSSINNLNEKDKERFIRDFKKLVTTFKWKDGKYVIE